MKAYVPPIILKVIITMTNIMLVTSKHMDSFIWTAILDLTGDLLVKVNYKTASEFSFLITLPVIVGATGLDLLKSWKYLSLNDFPMYAVIVAMLTVVIFLKVLEKIGLKHFAYYAYIIGHLIYTVRIAIDSYKSHIIKPLVLLTSIWDRYCYKLCLKSESSNSTSSLYSKQSLYNVLHSYLTSL